MYIRPFTIPSARLPACPPARLPACPLARLPACPPPRLPACPPARLPACPPARLPACPPARLPACPPARLPACPPARLPACPPAHRLFRSPDDWPDRPCACPRSLCLCSRSVYRSVRPVTYQFSRLPTQYPASRWPAGQIPRQLLISSPLRCSNPNP